VAAGVTVAEIEGRVRRGLLIPLHRGVYAVGHAVLRPAGHRLAAVLACGGGAVLSHRSAGAHWALRASAAAVIDVTSPQGAGRRRAGVRVHRSSIEPWECTMHDAVPITTPTSGSSISLRSSVSSMPDRMATAPRGCANCSPTEPSAKT
jgi:hypothetical protein